MTAQVPPRRLRRSRSGAVLGGVCAGVARWAGLDPPLLRIALVAVTVLTGGTGVPAYLVAWVLIPREAVDTPPVPDGTIPQPRAAHDHESQDRESQDPETSWQSS